MKKKIILVSLAAITLSIGLIVAIVVPVVLLTKNENKTIQINSSFKDPSAAKLKIQELITNGGSYDSKAEIALKLNDVNSKLAIMNLISDPVVVSTVNSTVAGTGPNAYTITVGIDYIEGYTGPATLPEIAGISANMNAVVAWSNLETTKIEIQKIITNNGPYLNTTAIENKLNLLANKNAIKALINNQSAVSTINSTLTGSGPNSYNITVSVDYKTGWTGPKNLQIITEMNANISILPTWVSVTNAKTTIQNLINASGPYLPLQGTTNANPQLITNKLNEMSNKTIIKSLITNESSILDITSNISGTGPDKFTITLAISYKAGYIGPSNLELINGLSASVNIEPSWININTARTTIQNLIDFRGPNDVNGVKLKLNTVENLKVIKGLINNENTIKSIDVDVAINNNLYVLTIGVKYNEGFQGSPTLVIDGLKETILLSAIAWTDDSRARTIIESFFKGTYNNVKEISDKINKPENKNLIKEYINNGNEIEDISVAVNGTNPTKLTILITATYKPGYISFQGTQIENLRLLGLNGQDRNFSTKIIAEEVTWKSSAKTIIEYLITERGPYIESTALNEITFTLNQAASKVSIFQQFNNLNQEIASVSLVEVTGTGPLSYVANVSFNYRNGFVGADGKSFGKIELAGIRANISVQPFWIASARDNIQTLITNNGNYQNSSAVITYIETQEEIIKSYIDVNQQAIESLSFAEISSSNNSVVVRVIINFNTGYFLHNNVNTLQDLTFTFTK